MAMSDHPHSSPKQLFSGVNTQDLAAPTACIDLKQETHAEVLRFFVNSLAKT